MPDITLTAREDRHWLFSVFVPAALSLSHLLYQLFALRFRHYAAIFGAIEIKLQRYHWYRMHAVYLYSSSIPFSLPPPVWFYEVQNGWFSLGKKPAGLRKRKTRWLLELLQCLFRNLDAGLSTNCFEIEAILWHMHSWNGQTRKIAHIIIPTPQPQSASYLFSFMDLMTIVCYWCEIPEKR